MGFRDINPPMQRGFSIVVETFACALVMIARANMARRALKRRAPARLRSSY